MHLSENEGIEGNTFVVTGGLGFVGSALCLDLLRRGARHVRAFDLRTTSQWSHDLLTHGVHIIKGDIAQKKDVEKALRGVDCVFHLASFGMSGKEMMQFSRVDQVNINGTCHILDACLEFGIQRLVYVSTYNVVFGGKEIVNGNETLPYFSIDDHVDPYGRSKSIAEQLVLKSNGRPFKKKNGKCLYTCAVRPAAIYGPGEERHFPRIVSLAKLGLLPFKIGDSSVKGDWIYVDNLVLALILASMGLLDDIPDKERCLIAAGQAYFVSDGNHYSSSSTFVKVGLLSTVSSSFDLFFKAWIMTCQGRPYLSLKLCSWERFSGQSIRYYIHYDLPRASLSVPQALLLGKIFWAIYTILYPWLNRRWLPQPLILPAEVYKVGVTHYFSFLKAKQELGYVPMLTPQEGMAATISYWQEKKRKTFDGPTIYAWLFCVIGMTSLFCAAYLPNVGPVPFIRAISIFFFRSMWIVRMVCLVATALHVGEAIYAWHLAKRVDPDNSKAWFWQTFVLGFFSLRFLLKRERERECVSM